MKLGSIEEVRKEHGSVTVALIIKQCKIIGVDVKKVNFRKPDWYQDFTWTKKQEARFKNQFIKYLYGNLKRTREIARFAHIAYKSKKKLEVLWTWWNLDYGWKRSDYETEV